MVGRAVAEAARRAKIDPADATLVYLEKQQSWFDRIAADWSRPTDEGQDGGDVLARLAARQAAMAWTAIDDARRLASGTSIQARCLECAEALPPRAVDGGVKSWLAELFLK